MTLRRRWTRSMMILVLAGAIAEIFLSRQISFFTAQYYARGWLTSSSARAEEFANDFIALELYEEGEELAESLLLRHAFDPRNSVEVDRIINGKIPHDLRWTIVSRELGNAGTLSECQSALASVELERKPHFTFCGKRAYMTVATSLRAAGWLVLAREVDETYIDRIAKVTDTEAIIIGPDGPMLGTARLHDGSRAPAHVGDELLALAMRDAPYFGVQQLNLGGAYGGFHAFEPDVFEAGATKLSGYVAVASIDRNHPEFPLKVMLWVPFSAMTQGVGYSTAMMSIGTLLILLGLYLVVRRLSERSMRPLQHLTTAAAHLEAGQLDVAVPIAQDEELAQLGAAFNAMVKGLRESQERLTQSKKMGAVGQLAGGIAHEINNPLGVILGFAQSLDRRTPETSPAKMPIGSIVREALRCKTLVQELLTFARTAKPTTESLELSAVVNETLSLLSARARVQDVEIVRVIDELPPIIGNKNQLQQVLVNLGNNALDAMDQGGRLTIRTRKEGAQQVLEVGDTGCGIPLEHRSQIFEPFFTTKAVGKGTGLGLSLAYEIVQQHGGSIRVCDSIDIGTTIEVRLPGGAA